MWGAGLHNLQLYFLLTRSASRIRPRHRKMLTQMPQSNRAISMKECRRKPSPNQDQSREIIASSNEAGGTADFQISKGGMGKKRLRNTVLEANPLENVLFGNAPTTGVLRVCAVRGGIPKFPRTPPPMTQEKPERKPRKKRCEKKLARI